MSGVAGAPGSAGAGNGDPSAAGGNPDLSVGPSRPEGIRPSGAADADPLPGPAPDRGRQPPASPLAGVARDSTYNLVRDGWRMVLAIGVSTLLARGLGQDGRGQLQIALLVPTMVVTFLSLGIGPATVYAISRRMADLATTVRSNTALALWLSALGVPVALVVGLAVGDEMLAGLPPVYLALALGLVPLNLLAAYLVAAYQGLQDFRRLNAIQMAGQTSLLAGVALAVWALHLGVAGALLAHVAAAAFTMALLARGLAPRLPVRAMVTLRIDVAQARRSLSFGARTHVASLGTFLNNRIDMLLLSVLAGAPTVGAYAVAVGLAEQLWVVPNALTPVLFPRIASLEGSEAARRRLTPTLTRHALWLGAVVGAAAWLAAPVVVGLVGGDEFRTSGAPRALRLLLPGVVVMGAGRIVSNDISARGRPGLVSVLSGAALVINVLLNLAWIPRYGEAGAALSSTMSYTLLAAMILLAYRRLTGVPWRALLVVDLADARRLIAAGRIVVARRRGAR